ADGSGEEIDLYPLQQRTATAAVPAGGAVSAMANLRDLSNVACIVGGDESDEMPPLPHKSQLSLHVEAVTNAVRDAGLKISETRSLWPPNMQPHSRAHENAESKPKDLGDLLVV